MLPSSIEFTQFPLFCVDDTSNYLISAFPSPYIFDILKNNIFKVPTL